MFCAKFHLSEAVLQCRQLTSAFHVLPFLKTKALSLSTEG